MIYFIQAKIGGPVKIGYTGAEIDKRLRNLQCGSPFPLRVLKTIEGSHADERELHSRFSASRLHGEWFEPTDELLEVIGVVGIRAITDRRKLIQAIDMHPPAVSMRDPISGDHLRLAEVLTDEWLPASEIGSKVGLKPQQAGNKLATLARKGWALRRMESFVSWDDRPLRGNFTYRDRP